MKTADASPVAHMQWIKHGPFLGEVSACSWWHSHAAVPIAERLDTGLWQLYFSGRDVENRSHTGRALVEFGAAGMRVNAIAPAPVLSPGPLGGFDDAGAMGSWIAISGGRRYLYYIGWNRGGSVPFRNAIGLAISDDGGASYVRYSAGPILDRDTGDPFFTASSCVLIEGTLWRMWYVSCVGWEIREGRPRHRYHIKYAESQDGIHWRRTGVVAIGLHDEEEYAISRPSVLKDDGVYRMWYSYRGPAYRIGYAESNDGISWNRRDDDVGILPGPGSWDAEMIEYPYVFDGPAGRCMLYNGNDYGRTGMGFAVLRQT